MSKIVECFNQAMSHATENGQLGLFQFMLRFSNPHRPISMYRADEESAAAIKEFLAADGLEDGSDMEFVESHGSFRIVWPSLDGIRRLAGEMSAAGMNHAGHVKDFFGGSAQAYADGFDEDDESEASTETHDAVEAESKVPRLDLVTKAAMAGIGIDALNTVDYDDEEKQMLTTYLSDFRISEATDGRWSVLPPLAVIEACLITAGKVTTPPRFSVRHLTRSKSFIMTHSRASMLARPLRSNECVPSMWLPVGTTLPSDTYIGDENTSSARYTQNGIYKYLTWNAKDYGDYASDGSYAAILLAGDAVIRQDPDTLKFLAKTKSFWEYARGLIKKWFELAGYPDVAVATNRFSRLAMSWQVDGVRDRSNVNIASGTSNEIACRVGLKPSGLGDRGDKECLEAAVYMSFSFLVVSKEDYAVWPEPESWLTGLKDVDMKVEEAEPISDKSLSIDHPNADDLAAEWFGMSHSMTFDGDCSLPSSRDVLGNLRKFKDSSDNDILKICSVFSNKNMLPSTDGDDDDDDDDDEYTPLSAFVAGLPAVFRMEESESHGGIEVRQRSRPDKSECKLHDRDHVVSAVYSGMTSPESWDAYHASVLAGETPKYFPPFTAQYDGGSVRPMSGPYSNHATPVSPERVTELLDLLEHHPNVMLNCTPRTASPGLRNGRAAWVVVETNLDAAKILQGSAESLARIESTLRRLFAHTVVCGRNNPVSFMESSGRMYDVYYPSSEIKAILTQHGIDPDVVLGENWCYRATAEDANNPIDRVTLMPDAYGRLVIAFAVSAETVNAARICYRSHVNLPYLSVSMARKLPTNLTSSCDPHLCIVPTGAEGRQLSASIVSHMARTFPFIDLTDYNFDGTFAISPDCDCNFTPGMFSTLNACVRGEYDTDSGYDTVDYGIAGVVDPATSKLPEFF